MLLSVRFNNDDDNEYVDFIFMKCLLYFKHSSKLFIDTDIELSVKPMRGKSFYYAYFYRYES